MITYVLVTSLLGIPRSDESARAERGRGAQVPSSTRIFCLALHLFYAVRVFISCHKQGTRWCSLRRRGQRDAKTILVYTYRATYGHGNRRMGVYFPRIA